jgi:hypothetical protein
MSDRQDGGRTTFTALSHFPWSAKITVAVDALEIADSWILVPQAGSEGKSVGAIWAANSLNTRTGRVR